MVLTSDSPSGSATWAPGLTFRNLRYARACPSISLIFEYAPEYTAFNTSQSSGSRQITRQRCDQLRDRPENSSSNSESLIFELFGLHGSLVSAAMYIRIERTCAGSEMLERSRFSWIVWLIAVRSLVSLPVHDTWSMLARQQAQNRRSPPTISKPFWTGRTFTG
ncbi:hypothetical protein D3C77_487830 [compost metagenome]